MVAKTKARCLRIHQLDARRRARFQLAAVIGEEAERLAVHVGERVAADSVELRLPVLARQADAGAELRLLRRVEHVVVAAFIERRLRHVHRGEAAAP